jgi:CBS domain-containing protein
MLLVLGVIGLGLLVWLMVSLVRLGLMSLRHDTTTAVFVVGFAVLMAVLSITEVTVFGMWLGLLCAFQSTAVRDARRRRTANGTSVRGVLDRGDHDSVGLVRED